MKMIERRLKSFTLILAASLFMAYSNLNAQQAAFDIHIINESVLTPIERQYANHTLNEEFVLKYWFAEISTDIHADQLQISLPESESVVFLLNRKKEQTEELISWRGKSSNDMSQASIVWNKGMITGMVSMSPNRVYRIQPLSENRHIVYLINPSKAPKEEPAESYQKMIDKSNRPPEEKHVPQYDTEDGSHLKLSGSDCYIRILVGFDNVAGPSLADPIGFALQCIELSNEIYANSKVNFEVDLAFAKVYNDAASTDIDDALAEWQFEFGDEKFESVFSDREQYDADFCILITENFDGEYVGLAATILASYNSAFCVVEDGAAIDNLSFTHEIGHLMGARHDLYVDGSGDFNHGYIIHSEKVRTVMAYNDECKDNGYDCNRVRYFSNPDIYYMGTGKKLGTASENHNERALDENESEFKDLEPIVSDKNILFPESISGTVYASVVAINTIEHLASYEITGSANVVWSAGSSMTLKPGFFAATGTTFQAKTAGCNAPRLESETENTAVDELSAIAMDVFPVPASGSTIISIKLEKDSEVQLRLLGLTGKMMIDILPLRFVNSVTITQSVDLKSIAPGIYFVEGIVGGEKIVKKLIVVNAEY